MFTTITTQFDKVAADVTAATSAAAAKASETAAAGNTRLAELVGPVAETVVDNYAQASNTVFDAVVDVNRRLVDAVPAATDAGTRYVDFVERAVAVNRSWNDRAVELIRANVTAATATPTPTPAPAEAPATQATPRKATARKATARKTTARKTTARKTAARKTTATKSAARRSAS